MKAERRQELKHNELADWLGERMETYKPHATGILLGLVVLAALVLGSLWYFSGETEATALAWTDYFDAFNQREPQKALQKVATDRSGSKAAWWALESLGDMSLAQGAALLQSDRSEAQKQLEKAVEVYKQVEGADDAMLRARAQLGLAKAYESLCKTEDARKQYEQLAQSQKDSAIGKLAAEGAERLKNPRDVAFLEWFAKQTPKRPAPIPGVGGTVPGLPNDLPERPDISLPSGINLSGLSTGVPQETGPSFPAPAGSTAPTEQPTADASKADAQKSDSPTAEKKADSGQKSLESGEKAATPEASGAADKPESTEKKPD